MPQARRKPLSLEQVELLWSQLRRERDRVLGRKGNDGYMDHEMKDLEEEDEDEDDPAALEGEGEAEDNDDDDDDDDGSDGEVPPVNPPVNLDGPDDRDSAPAPATTQPQNKPSSSASLLSVPNLLSRRGAPSPSTNSSSSTPSFRSSASTSTQKHSMSNSSSRTSLSISRESPYSPSPPITTKVADSPMFVTWNITSRSGHKNLRGCIGTFEAQELEQGLATYAMTSAFEDSRFPPITAGEMPRLECGVTLLTDFESAPDPMAWELGKHGIRISFTYHSRRYGATYLPDVPREQGWTKKDTIISLMRKAGWTGRENDWQKVGDLKLVRYQGRKLAIKYDEWKNWNDWVMNWT
ncbi:MAG: hypothetical protein M1831_006178 [Alyxoria varia]|nr:MAG: hypothetical protein M1831_006178 [Alyxoria varia]